MGDNGKSFLYVCMKTMNMKPKQVTTIGCIMFAQFV